MLCGYARVSATDPTSDRQVDALRRAGVGLENIHIDRAIGAKAGRPELDALLSFLGAGDTLTITRLDRVARSMVHFVALGADLSARGVGLRVLEQEIDTTMADGRALLATLAVLAELQSDLTAAHTRDGLAAARSRGRKGGRPPRLTPEQIALAQDQYDAGERTVRQIADLLSVPRTTVYGYLDTSGNGRRPATRYPGTGPAAGADGGRPSSRHA